MVNASTVRVPMNFETQLFSPLSIVEHYWKFAARLQVDTLSLATRRAQAMMELSTTLSSCTSPDQLLTEQVRYWQLAQRQYAEVCTQAFVKATALTVITDAEAGDESVAIEPLAQDLPQRQRDVLTVVEAPASSVDAAQPPAADAIKQQAADHLPPVRVRLRRSA